MLNSITRDQLQVLGEIAANVIHSVILLNLEEKKDLKKCKLFFFVLGDKKTLRKLKGDYLKRNQRDIVKNRKTLSENMVDVMQKSVLLPYEKYKRLVTLQETHGSYSELDNENVSTASDKLTDLPKPEREREKRRGHSDRS